MRRYAVKKRLPSCDVPKSLLTQIEVYLERELNRRLGEDLARMRSLYGLQDFSTLTNYCITLVQNGEEQHFTQTAQLSDPHLPQGIEQMQLSLHIGKPELLGVKILFQLNTLPTLEVSTLRRDQKKNCQEIAEGLVTVICNWSNRNTAISSRTMLILIGLLPSLGITAYGLLSKVDPFLLLAAQGWSLALSAGAALCVQRLFPLVRFRSAKRIFWQRLLWVVVLAILIAGLISYTVFLMFRLQALG